MLKQKITQLHSGKAHLENKKQYSKNSSINFDEAIRSYEHQGHRYNPETYNQQMHWLRSRYYKATGNSSKIILFRIFADDVDIQTTEQEVHSALEQRFGGTLHPLLQERAIYLLQTTIGQKYDASSKEPFVVQYYSFFRNIYKPPSLQPTAKVFERPVVWQQYLDRLMPPENLCTQEDGSKIKEQDYLEALLAQRIQAPSEPNTVVPVLRGQHGTGKGFIGDMLMQELLGKTNYMACSLKEALGEFNNDVFEKILFQIEEVTLSNRNTITQQLKTLSTQERPRANAKHKNAKQTTRYFGFYLSSNEEYPVRIEENDRRFFIPCFSKHKINDIESHQFFSNVFALWLKEQGGFQDMLNYLSTLDLTSFNFRRPPMTSAKEMLMETDTNQKQMMHRAALTLDASYKNYACTVEAVSKEFKLNLASAAEALDTAGFRKERSRHFKTDDSKTVAPRMWVHKSFNWEEPQDDLYLFNPDSKDDRIVLIKSICSMYTKYKY